VTGAPLDQARVLQDVDRAVASGERFLSTLPVVRPAADNSAWYDAAVRAPLAGLMAMLGSAGDVAELCERTHAVLAPLRDVPLPAVFEHGDLSHPNLFVADDGTLLVIDWERATDAGVPGHDLVFYLQFLSQCRHGFATSAEQLEAFDRAFTGGNAWARSSLERHLDARGVDPQLAGLLVVTCWARSAATLASRLDLDARAAGGTGDAVAAAVLAERDVTLWRHALRRAEAGELLARNR
jgi:hypothetical protein